MNLTSLQYFIDAVRLGSVAASAKRHRVSSSAVSQAIRSLEDRFGVELITHEKSRFELTEAGRTCVESGGEVILALERLDHQMAAQKNPRAGVVRVATQQSLAHSFLPEMLARFNEKYPEIRIVLRLATTNVVKEWLEHRDICIAISLDNVDFHKFSSKKLRSGQFVFVTSIADAKKKSKQPDHLGPFVVTTDTREVDIFRRAYSEVYESDPTIAMEVASWGVIKRLAQAGLGTGLIPDYLLNIDEKKLLRRADLGLPDMDYSVSAWYPSRKKDLSRAAAIFLEELTAFAQTFCPPL